MSTYLLPTEGTVYVGGLDVTKHELDVRRRIGYLPESNILYPQMRVDDYLSFVGKMRGLSGGRLKERLDWCVEAMKLSTVMGKKNMECSKGFKQRISLAATLIHDPEYIILDEPTVGLDPLQIFMVRDFLRLISKEKIVLFSSHILQEVAAMTQRVIIIHDGKIIGDVTFDAKDNRTEKLEAIFAAAVRGESKPEAVA